MHPGRRRISQDWLPSEARLRLPAAPRAAAARSAPAPAAAPASPADASRCDGWVAASPSWRRRTTSRWPTPTPGSGTTPAGRASTCRSARVRQQGRVRAVRAGQVPGGRAHAPHARPRRPYGRLLRCAEGAVDAGVPVMTAGQSDLMRAPTGWCPSSRRRVWTTPDRRQRRRRHQLWRRRPRRRHERLSGARRALDVPRFPAAGFILEIGGIRVYISGDTDLYGDMKLVGQRYQPNVALVCVGGGPNTMDPAEAAVACQWLGVYMPFRFTMPTTRTCSASRPARISARLWRRLLPRCRSRS